jgi:integral membrane sensor domain MASE1
VSETRLCDPMRYCLLTAGYIITGKLSLLLAVPPGYASPVFPPAGIAIAAMLIAGPATLP